MRATASTLTADPRVEARTRREQRAALGLVVLGAAIALTTAFGLEYLGGYAPCSLCIVERWPWGGALAVGLLGLYSGYMRLALLLTVLLLGGNALLSGYHVGVEGGWFELPGSCAAGASASTIEELRAQLLNARPTCDRVAVRIFGLSLAAWNGIAAAAVAALAAAVLIRSRPTLNS